MWRKSGEHLGKCGENPCEDVLFKPNMEISSEFAVLKRKTCPYIYIYIDIDISLPGGIHCMWRAY